LLLTVGLTLATELLSNNQSTNNQSSVGDTDPNIRGSYNFSGIQNVSTSGVPVPILYGHVFSGSILISAGVDSAQLVNILANEGTYSKSAGSTTITVNINNHKFVNGETVRLDFLDGGLSGSRIDPALFLVQNVTTNTFTSPTRSDESSLSGSGNVKVVESLGIV